MGSGTAARAHEVFSATIARRAAFAGTIFALAACGGESSSAGPAAGRAGAAGTPVGSGGAAAGSTSGSSNGGSGGGEAGGSNGGKSSAGSGDGKAGSSNGGSGGTGSSGTAGATGATGGSMFDPDVPFVQGGEDDMLPVSTPGLAIVNGRVLGFEFLWVGTVENVGAEALCPIEVMLRFLDAEGRELDTAAGGVFATPYDKPSDGPADHCFAPGERGHAVAYMFRGFADPAHLTEIHYSITARPADGALPRAWASIEDESWIAEQAGSALHGNLIVGEWPVRGLGVYVFPLDAAGIPLGFLMPSSTISGALAPGSSVEFSTEPFAGDFTSYAGHLAVVADAQP